MIFGEKSVRMIIALFVDVAFKIIDITTLLEYELSNLIDTQKSYINKGITLLGKVKYKSLRKKY